MARPKSKYTDTATLIDGNPNLTQIAALAQPIDDKILYFDISSEEMQYLTLGSGVSIVADELVATGVDTANSPATGEFAKFTDSNTIEGRTTAETKSDLSLNNVVNVDTSTTANITDSANKRFVTDANLTTIGNQSGTNTGDNATNTQYSGLAASKQDTLVSATNIKTVNGSTLLGAGDLVVAGSMTVGSAIASGTNNRLLFQDGSGNLAESNGAQYDGTTATFTDLAAPTTNLTDNTNKRFVTDANLVTIGNQSGTNTGDQTSIVGISGTKAQFDTAVSDGNILYVGDAPTAHATSHKLGGGDVILLNEFGNPTASIQFNQQQGLQFRLENRTSDPGTPAVGEIWLRTDL